MCDLGTSLLQRPRRPRECQRGGAPGQPPAVPHLRECLASAALLCPGHVRSCAYAAPPGRMVAGPWVRQGCWVATSSPGPLLWCEVAAASLVSGGGPYARHAHHLCGQLHRVSAQ